ncbi:hypothetical protein ACFO1B_38020 [Dactylosporangium siamense]|uniref:Uncharacterized protein n=1 Tax=Dactylosporangium siamense TaxID=685454 RepID=A0A919UEY6_9ACTN|nr:hypothetical protein [Dactylosporangium siamense]GIG49571.1 hypothetical protein Dsi01nite_076120 [Dactylosporangium siamense]
MDPSQQWPYPQQGQPGPQYPQQGQPGPQYPPQQPGPQYPPQQPAPQQYPPQQPAPQQYPPQYQPPQQPNYGNQPYSAAPYNIAPNSAAPYSGPPANAYQPPATGMLPVPPPSRSKLPMVVISAVVLLAVLAVSIVVVALSKDKKADPVAGPSTAPASQAGPVDSCLVGKWNQTGFQKTVDFAGTDIEKREGIGKVKMVGAGKVWTINADGSAIEDDTKFVYSGKDDKGRTITGTFQGTAEWQVKTVGRTIEYAGKESDAAVVFTVDGRKAGTITLEPNLDPVNYTCVGDVWRTTPPTEPDTFARYDRVK